MMKDSMKWLLCAFAAVFVAGCGGSGDGRVPPPPPGPDRSAPTIVLGNTAGLTTTFISGQGRRAPGSLIAVIQRIAYQNNVDDIIPVLDQSTFPELKVELDAYSINSRTFSVSVPGDQGSRFMTQFPLEVFSLEQENDFGGTDLLTQNPPALLAEPPFDIQLRMFPGRYSSVQVNLDDAILNWDGFGVTFDRDLFIFRNYNEFTNTMTSFLSDQISFDLSAMPAEDRPLMTNGDPAEAVLYSGDAIAMSRGFGFDGSFELLDPVRVEQGIIRPGPILGGVQAPGTYTLLELDPRDLEGLTKITALQGSWRSYKSVMTDFPVYSMVAMPNSGDDDRQTLLVWKHNPDGQITAMWQGTLRYTVAAGTPPTTGFFSLWPIGQIDDADAANEVKGFVSNLITRPTYATVNGRRVVVGYDVLKGDYNVTETNPLFPFPLQGGFAVFRR